MSAVAEVLPIGECCSR